MQFFIHCNIFCQEYKFTYLLLIAVNKSCESTAAVNISMNAVLFKGYPLKEVKLNFGKFIPCCRTTSFVYIQQVIINFYRLQFF